DEVLLAGGVERAFDRGLLENADQRRHGRAVAQRTQDLHDGAAAMLELRGRLEHRHEARRGAWIERAGGSTRREELPREARDLTAAVLVLAAFGLVVVVLVLLVVVLVVRVVALALV